MWSVLLSLNFLLAFILSILLLIFVPIIYFRIVVEPSKGICRCKTKLYGKVALITGGNSGIGFETAKDLAKRGARVIIASRNDKKSEEAVAIIKEATGNNDVEYRHLNLANQDNIEEFAEKFNRDFERLDILVNNAGCSTIKLNKNMKNGTDLLMQVNYVGPFYLTQLLLEKLIASKPSRIVITSSYAHNTMITKNFKVEDLTKVYTTDRAIRYAKTKLCNVLWARELSRRLPHGVTANAVHPGVVATNIFGNLGTVFHSFFLFVVYLFFKTVEEGAYPIIHLCVAPELEYSTGGYYADCKIAKSSKLSKDEDLAKKLWARTIELINS